MADVVMQALAHVWVTLAPLNRPMAVMGGIALAAWKHVRATQDVDLLISLGPMDTDLVLRTLQEADIRPKHEPPILEIGPTRILQALHRPQPRRTPSK